MSSTEMSDPPPPPPTAGQRPAGKSVENVVAAAGTCAFGALVLGAFLGAAWPGAVAACGISAMGAVASFCLLKYADRADAPNPARDHRAGN
jgi:hypothetical protein